MKKLLQNGREYIIRIVRKLSQMLKVKKVLYKEEMICITEDTQERLN